MFRKLIFWFCFPFCLPQAIWVRKTATRSAAADGEPSGVIGQGQPIRLLAVGDSIIAGVGAETLDKALVGQTAHWLSEALDSEVQWSAVGENGITSAGIIRKQLPTLPNEAHDFIVVSVGVNDVTRLTGLQRWTDNIHTLISRLRDTAPNAVIAFAGVPPLSRFPRLPQPLRAVLGLRARMLDKAAVEVIQQYDHTIHVPLSFDLQPEHFAADGYHPNEDSYVEYGRLMAEALVSVKNG